MTKRRKVGRTRGATRSTERTGTASQVGRLYPPARAGDVTTATTVMIQPRLPSLNRVRRSNRSPESSSSPRRTVSIFDYVRLQALLH